MGALVERKRVQENRNADQNEPNGIGSIPSAGGLKPPVNDHWGKQEYGENKYQNKSMCVHEIACTRSSLEEVMLLGVTHSSKVKFNCWTKLARMAYHA